jgi:hypothetical protein
LQATGRAHREQVRRVEVARLLGPQQQVAGQELFWCRLWGEPSIPSVRVMSGLLISGAGRQTLACGGTGM